MTEKMKTLKIKADVHHRLNSYKVRLQAKRNAFVSFGEAIDEALKAVVALEALKEEKKVISRTASAGSSSSASTTDNRAPPRSTPNPEERPPPLHAQEPE